MFSTYLYPGPFLKQEAVTFSSLRVMRTTKSVIVAPCSHSWTVDLESMLVTQTRESKSSSRVLIVNCFWPLRIFDYELNEKDLQEARDVFSLFDSVGDEKILVKDIGEVVRALGLNPTESDIRKFNNRSDPGERITFEMFVPIYQALAKEQKDINPEEFIEGFRVFDKESNGFISAAELRHLLTALGERLREDEVDQLLAGMENSQGLVPYEAFVQRILS
ncbi:Myosin-2 essential light chain [Clonorchis sinensis]|uniref:Myosin-2 essential light chain n=1 Tax=Clonorchis sinensis TaxID=79923 RepID=A0A8T1MNT2_CLOSI|nr:Myosin-2 essential light chain [Clonorchis sinensis]